MASGGWDAILEEVGCPFLRPPGSPSVTLPQTHLLQFALPASLHFCELFPEIAFSLLVLQPAQTDRVHLRCDRPGKSLSAKPSVRCGTPPVFVRPHSFICRGPEAPGLCRCPWSASTASTASGAHTEEPELPAPRLPRAPPSLSTQPGSAAPQRNKT